MNIFHINLNSEKLCNIISKRMMDSNYSKINMVENSNFNVITLHFGPMLTCSSEHITNTMSTLCNHKEEIITMICIFQGHGISKGFIYGHIITHNYVLYLKKKNYQ